ncbi:MAG: FHA domain-containing protein, partial [Myxococcota bacterium]
MFKLVIADDDGKTTVVPLVRDEITIGRKEGNTIRLTERNVSRRHAKLFKANGAFTVEDLRSYNGVKVNGHRIDGAVHLKAGDQITIGDYSLALQLDAAEGVANVQTAVVPNPAAADAKTAMIQAPDEPPPPPRLVMLSPPAPGAEFALSSGSLKVGRAEDLDAWVNHRSISREHAEIVREGNHFKIIDLRSANGVRVNGADISEAILQAGDVLELGQVRFRFVGEGEHYVFDADRTIQMEAVVVEGGSRAPIYAAIAIIGIAIIVAIGFALADTGDDDITVQSLDPDPQIPQVDPDPEVPTNVPSNDNFSEALAACETAVDEARFSDALDAAERALAMNSDSLSATRCRAAAEEGVGQEELFERGVQELDRSEFESAFFTFNELPEDSPFRERDEVDQARDGLVELHLTEGRQALRREPSQSVEHANQILTMADLSDNQRTAAEELREAARRQAVQLASTTDTRPNRDERPDPPQMDTPMMEQRQSMTPQDCAMASNPNRCIVTNVQPRSQRDLDIVIQAHRDLGQSGSAYRLMRTYITR